MYHTYIPYVSKPKKKKGIAMSHEYVNMDDVNKLNCSWYYDWGNFTNETVVDYIPMSWSGNFIQTAQNDILVFNEPDNRTQSNLTPEVAASRYGALLNTFPIDHLIVGGWMYWGGYSWAQKFIESIDKAKLPRPKRYHMHGYVEWGLTPANVIDFWKQCMCLTGGIYTITEFGDVDGKLSNVFQLVDYLENEPRVERYSIFTSRITGNESWYPSFWPQPAIMGLINNDTNQLTEIGEYYSKI
jgi:hypothetical protein